MVFKNSNNEKGGITKTTSPSYPRSPGTSHNNSPLPNSFHAYFQKYLLLFFKKIKDKDILYTATWFFSQREKDRQTD